MTRLSSHEGFLGKIKDSPDDFIVEEITKSSTVLKASEKFTHESLRMQTSPTGKFTVFVMQKRDWNTIQALKIIAKRAGRGIKSVGFAGTKDRASVSTQLCSIFGAKAEHISTLHVKDISINGAWQSDTGVELGDLLGNRFTIAIKESNATEERIKQIENELNGVFPNYFGEQRFGYRDNNYDVGLAIMKGEFEKAAMDYLTNTKNERNLDSIEARERLAKERDFTAALQYFPYYLKYELTVIEYLSRYPTDYANAIRRLPRQLSLMFVHSVQGLVFNKEIEYRIKNKEIAPKADDILCPTDQYGFPDMDKRMNASDGRLEGLHFIAGNIVGYDSERINYAEKQILEEMGLTKEMFKIQSMPELSCKGNYRVLFAPFKDFSSKVDGSNATLSFSLPSGSYATVLLNEFVNSPG
ncbi:MAG TPA: tRNA pseudouridine(13) synthase TruD [Candidatus Acidoferrum sp.]|nr:tRNA pseudouridine(13) synthase TruD [Candidatus Acidoferrum sp.]